MKFDDRRDAGTRLADRLEGYRGQDVVVLALPRGGVPIADVVAARLEAPLDLLLVRKIGVPWQPELAMGAIVDGDQPVIVKNEDVLRLAHVPPGDFDTTCQRELREIERRRQRYIGDSPRQEIAGRIVILVDDGIATGATVRAAINGLRNKQPKKIVLAVPVASPETIEDLKTEVDEIICLHSPTIFFAISPCYRNFPQVSDDEVVQILTAARQRLASG